MHMCAQMQRIFVRSKFGGYVIVKRANLSSGMFFAHFKYVILYKYRRTTIFVLKYKQLTWYNILSEIEFSEIIKLVILVVKY